MKITNAKHSSLTVLGLSVVALLLVLTSTGGAVAGAMITGTQIKDGTITTADVKNKTLRTTDLAPATVQSLRGRTGATGATGQPGPIGPAGAAGVNGLTDVTVRTFKSTDPVIALVEGTCRNDERAVSFGVDPYGLGGGQPTIAFSAPRTAHSENPKNDAKVELGSGWRAGIENDSATGTVGATLYLLCAKS